VTGPGHSLARACAREGVSGAVLPAPWSATFADVLAWLGLAGEDADNWRVEGSIVVDEPLMSPYVREVPLPVETYDKLAEERYQ
jgi:hypothetical protein